MIETMAIYCLVIALCCSSPIPIQVKIHLDWWTIALQTINFAILVWLLNRFLYRPVLRVIDTRKAEVRRQYDDAKAVEDKAKAHLAAIEAERAGISAERETLLRTAAAAAEEAAEARRSRAEREAQVLLDGARKTLAGPGGGWRIGRSPQRRPRPRR